MSYGGGYPPPSGGYPPPQGGGGYPPPQGGGYPPAVPGQQMSITVGFAQPGVMPGYPPEAGPPPSSGPPPPPGQQWAQPAPMPQPQVGGYPAPQAAAGFTTPGYAPVPANIDPYAQQRHHQQQQQQPQYYQQQQQPQYRQPQYQQPQYQQHAHQQAAPVPQRVQSQQVHPVATAPPPENMYEQTPPAPRPPQKVTKPKPKVPPPMEKPEALKEEQMYKILDQPFECHGTVKPVTPFDAEQDAEIIRKAMKGLGTDEAAIIQLITSRSNEQRQKIKLQFKTMYGKDLIKDLNSELSGDLKETVMALFMPTTYYDAWSIHNAIKGLGTNEEILIEILCTRTNDEIKEIVKTYQQEFGKSLEQDCIGDTSGHFKRLLVSMCQGNRDEGNSVDDEKARKDANDLYQAGEGKWGTDESTFNKILAVRNFAQLRATFKEYVKICQRDIINSIDREFSGDVRSGMRAIAMCVKSRPVYFAERLHRSMHGLGTDDHTLIRVVVSRSEIDLVEIKEAFLERYLKTLYLYIEQDTSGDYRKLLLSIVGKN
ncbi:annexin B9-like [Saccoglossus kowalevskii]|uniref:Annexin n=1 Tax=Saccoglossus kowalevskii TaxID=10224 RepID=A0ABM0GPV9_SACKO|nr:PREDICTED: annexin A7-like [Saccoglossus kowalevskii]